MIKNSCRWSICLVSSTGSLGTAGQINYASSKAAFALVPEADTLNPNKFEYRGTLDEEYCDY